MCSATVRLPLSADRPADLTEYVPWLCQLPTYHDGWHVTFEGIEWI